MEGLRCRRQCRLFRVVTTRERGGVIDKSDNMMREGIAIPPEVKSPVRYDRGIESDVNILPSSEILSFSEKALHTPADRSRTLQPDGRGSPLHTAGQGKGNGAPRKPAENRPESTAATRRRSLSETGYQKNTGRKKGCPTHVQAAPDSCGPTAANLPEPVVSGFDTSLHSIFRIRPR